VEEEDKDYIRNQVFKLTAMNCDTEQVDRKKKPTPVSIGGVPRFMFAVVIFLSFAIFVSFAIKRRVVVEPNVIASSGGVTADEIRSIVKSSNAEMMKKLDETANRVWLLGLIHNENTQLEQDANPTMAQKYVYLDENWKLNKMPEHLSLNAEQRKLLEQMIAR
jgi:hypothetical protein